MLYPIGLALLLPVPGVAAAQGADAEPQAAPEQGRTVARPMLALDDRLLRSAFLDLVGRPPLCAERARWIGRGLGELLDELLGSEPFWSHWYEEQLYYFLLIDNFSPESERMVAIPRDLAEGRLDVREAVHRIAISASFDRRNPGADTFVTVVMEQLCGRTVQKSRRELEIGKRLYDGGDGVFLGRSGRSQADVVDIAVHSRDFAESFLAHEYRRLLKREAEPGELRDAVRALFADPREYVPIVRGWLTSPAYEEAVARGVPLENRLFVRALFVDLLDRPPAESEAEPLREALDGMSDSAPLRSVLVRLMLESGRVPLPEKDAIDDPTAWIADLFRRWLGREARKEELAAFVEAFHDPACRPQTIVYALLSSPEYHRR
jgi:hypothetical protein